MAHRTKFHPRARICVFLRYPTRMKGYKLYDIQIKQVFISHDAMFHEDLFPFHTIIPPTQVEDPFPDWFYLMLLPIYLHIHLLVLLPIHLQFSLPHHFPHIVPMFPCLINLLQHCNPIPELCTILLDLINPLHIGETTIATC